MAVNTSRKGGIYIEIGATTQPLSDALDRAKLLGTSTAKEISEAFGKGISPADAGRISSSITTTFAQARVAAQNVNKEIASFEKEFKKMGEEIGLAGKGLETYAKAQAKALHKKNADDFTQALRSIRRQTGLSRVEMNELAKSLGGVGNEFDKVIKSGGAFGSLLGNLRIGPTSIAAAGAFAGYKAFGFGKESFSLASEYEMLGVVVQQVGKVAGYSSVEIDKNVNAIRRMGIAGIEARKTLTQLVQAQVDITKTPALARVAQDAAVIGGINSSEAFERMVHGISAAQTQVLRGIGINVNFEQAYSRYAASIGKATSELTENEKMQARVNAVLESGESIAGAYEASMETLGKQMSSLSRIQQDFSTDAGKLLVDMANTSGVVDFYATSVERLNRAVLVERGRRAGLSISQIGELGGDVQALRELVELYESVQKKALAFSIHMKSLEARGVDTSVIKRQYDEKIKPFLDAQGKIVALEKQMQALQDPSLYGSNYLGDSKIKAELNLLQEAAGDTKASMAGLIEVFEKLLNIQPITPADSPSEKLLAKKKEIEAMAAEVEKEFAKTDGGRIEAARAKASRATTLHFNLNTDKSLAVFKSAQKELENLLSKGKGIKIGGGASSLTSNIKQLASEIERLEFDKLSPFEQIEVQAQKYLAQNYPAQTVEQWKGLKLEALDKKQFDESTKALQNFEKEYQATFKNSKDVTQSVRSEIDKMRVALETAYQNAVIGASEYEDVLRRIGELEARRIEDASRDAMNGARRALRNYADEAQNAAKNVEDFTTSSFNHMEDALVEFVTKGKFEFSNLVDSIIADLARLAIRQTITGPLASGLLRALGGAMTDGIPSWDSMAKDMEGNFITAIDPSSIYPSAQGNVFAAGTGLEAYTNTVISAPTLFPFAKGGVPNIGLMGEAGAEAIVPLTRTSNGDLGVRAEGMGKASVTVSINIENHAGVQVEAEQRTDDSGNVFLDIQLLENVESGLAQRVYSGRSGLARAYDQTRNISPNMANMMR